MHFCNLHLRSLKFSEQCIHLNFNILQHRIIFKSPQPLLLTPACVAFPGCNLNKYYSFNRLSGQPALSHIFSVSTFCILENFPALSKHTLLFFHSPHEALPIFCLPAFQGFSNPCFLLFYFLYRTINPSENLSLIPRLRAFQECAHIHRNYVLPHCLALFFPYFVPAASPRSKVVHPNFYYYAIIIPLKHLPNHVLFLPPHRILAKHSSCAVATPPIIVKLDISICEFSYLGPDIRVFGVLLSPVPASGYGIPSICPFFNFSRNKF